MVGRPREFDLDLALDAAMQAFWAKGYEATSLADIMAATGLHKGSLYQAFGDKHSLFLQALRRYLEEMRKQEHAVVEQAPTPLDGLRAAGHGILEMADSDEKCPRGCLAVNALVELAPHDDAVKDLMDDHMQRMRGSLEESIANAQAAGQISKNRTPEAIASLLMTFMAGLAATLKSGLDKEKAHQLLDAQMEAIF